MHPKPIDEQPQDGFQRIVMSAPNGDLNDEQVAPMEVLVTMVDVGEGKVAPMFISQWVVAEGDMAKIIEDGAITLTCIGMQPPVMVEAGWTPYS